MDKIENIIDQFIEENNSCSDVTEIKKAYNEYIDNTLKIRIGDSQCICCENMIYKYGYCLRHVKMDKYYKNVLSGVKTFCDYLKKIDKLYLVGFMYYLVLQTKDIEKVYLEKRADRDGLYNRILEMELELVSKVEYLDRIISQYNNLLYEIKKVKKFCRTILKEKPKNIDVSNRLYSNGEEMVWDTINKLRQTEFENIIYLKREFGLEGLSKLRFDFFGLVLKDNNLKPFVIEYDGKTHYVSSNKNNNFVSSNLKKNDNIKDKYVLEKGWEILRLNYLQSSIEIKTSITKFLKKLNIK